MEKERCLGVGVMSLSPDEIVNDIEKRIQLGLKSSIVAVNPEKIMSAQKDGILAAFINDATYAIPDGIGVVIASKMSKGCVTSRVTGIEMMNTLLHYANQKESRVFLYGGKVEVVQKTVEVLKEQFPNILIVGYEHGYAQDHQKVIRSINESGADFLFVALGSPRQELWIHHHLPLLQVKVVQGVGGSFDVFAGKVRRAPILFQKLGLEWLYRLIKEPKRFKRQLLIPRFLWKIVIANIMRTHNKSLVEGEQ